MRFSLIQGDSSAELRQKYLDLHALPLARAAFAADPELGSLTVAVGQFWSDEAEDAVHVELYPSTKPDPAWPEPLHDPVYAATDEHGFLELTERGEAVVGWKTGRSLNLPFLDSNEAAITAFASFCIEGCHQEMTPLEYARPWAILRRGDGDAVTVEVVGEMIRPEWEDRFDVGFGAEPAEFDPRAAGPSSAPTPPGPSEARAATRSTPAPLGHGGGLRGLLRRWFGR